MVEAQNFAAQHLQLSKSSQALQYNKKAGDLKIIEPNQWVWLSRKNIQTRRSSSKLDTKFIGPFRVIEPVGSHASRLELTPPFSKLQPVFNNNLLLPYFGRIPSEGGP